MLNSRTTCTSNGLLPKPARANSTSLPLIDTDEPSAVLDVLGFLRPPPLRPDSVADGALILRPATPEPPLYPCAERPTCDPKPGR